MIRVARCGAPCRVVVCVVTDVDVEDLDVEDLDGPDGMSNLAAQLYGMIHARFILTAHGLNAMVRVPLPTHINPDPSAPHHSTSHHTTPKTTCIPQPDERHAFGSVPRCAEVSDSRL